MMPHLLIGLMTGEGFGFNVVGLGPVPAADDDLSAWEDDAFFGNVSEGFHIEEAGR